MPWSQIEINNLAKIEPSQRVEYFKIMYDNPSGEYKQMSPVNLKIRAFYNIIDNYQEEEIERLQAMVSKINQI